MKQFSDWYDFYKYMKEREQKLGIKGCIDLFFDETSLDGSFTSHQLRKIADEMDKLKEIYEYSTFGED